MSKQRRVIEFDEGFFLAGSLPPETEQMIRRAEEAQARRFAMPAELFDDPGSRGAAEQQRFITLAEHEVKIKEIDDQLSAVFGRPITIRVMIEAEQARAAFAHFKRMIEQQRADALWPWLALSLIAILAALTGLLIGAFK